MVEFLQIKSRYSIYIIYIIYIYYIYNKKEKIYIYTIKIFL